MVDHINKMGIVIILSKFYWAKQKRPLGKFTYGLEARERDVHLT